MKIRKMILIALFAALMVIGAYIRIPNPFFPVYFTFQGVICAFAGLLIGSKAGASAVILYIVMGLCGLPVFSTPTAGPQYVLQPTFGFLLGCAAAAYIMGKMGESPSGFTLKKSFMASLTGLLVFYTVGINYMALIQRFYLQTPLGYGALLSSMALYFAKDAILFLFVAVSSVQIRQRISAFTIYAFEMKK